VAEVGGGLGLGVEPVKFIRIGKLAGQDHLDRDGSVEANLQRLEDDGRTASPAHLGPV
jgi:hypothetical protein